MLSKGLFLFLTFCLLCTLPASAQQPEEPQKLFSPYTAETFYEIGYDLYTGPNANTLDDQAALVFFNAATDLDERTQYVLPDLIKLIAKFPHWDYPRQMYSFLVVYGNEKADLQVARLAVRYLLERLNSRELRETLLKDLLEQLRDKNAVLASELATQFALLAAEKADRNTAAFLLMQAYEYNRYNKLAFAKLDEILDEPLPSAAYARHLRFAMRENPLSLEYCLKFAQSAESLTLYDVAADAYGYCADLFAYLYPSQPLPASIYLPRAVSCYNSKARQYKCLEIADRIHQSGRFDILLQAIAARAALKLNYKTQADEIFKSVEDKARKLIIDKGLLISEKRKAKSQAQSPIINNQLSIDFSWFYCFARPDAEKALLWANKAYAAAPNLPLVIAILAYSLVMNQEHQLARPLVAQSYKDNQIAGITMGLIQLEQQNKTQALEALKSAIAMDPGSLEAEYARQILQANGSDYIPTVEPASVLEELKKDFGNSIVPKFIAPGKMFYVELTADSGTGFSYGSKITGTLLINNNSSEPLIISDDGLFNGNIRVDAEITGDLQLKIPNLIAEKVQPSLPVNPGQSTSVPLKLFTGRLKETLLSSPQADLQLKFTAYLDPVVTDNARLRNALPDIAPATLTLRRSPINLTGRYLRDRLEYLSKGNQGQKVKSTILFAGLLLEQQAMAKTGALYKFMYQEPAMLKSALLRSLADRDWVVKLQTMAAIVKLPLDYDLTGAIAANLYDDNWPVRMMSVFLLAKSQGPDFKKVLDSAVRSDDNIYVREMAVAFGADVPEPEQPPPAEPTEPTTEAPAAPPETTGKAAAPTEQESTPD